MLISEVERVIREVFDAEKGVVKSVETVYEEPDDHDDHINLVISIHNLTVEETMIIHTKFIFKTDLQKINIKHNSFSYLYDINCHYEKIGFSDVNNLNEILTKIIQKNKFGKDIKILSEFIDSPAKRINSYFGNNHITKYSAVNVEYTPIKKMCPCKETTFDFKIDMGNDYMVELDIKKEDSHQIHQSEAEYKFTFKLLGKSEVTKVDNIMNIHAIIGGKISEMLDKITN